MNAAVANVARSPAPTANSIPNSNRLAAKAPPVRLLRPGVSAHCLTHNHSDDVTPPSTQRNPHSDLVSPGPHRIRNDAVQPGPRQHQRDARKIPTTTTLNRRGATLPHIAIMRDGSSRDWLSSTLCTSASERA